MISPPNLFQLALLCIGLLSCTTSSWIAEAGVDDGIKFPQASYDKVLYYHHQIENPEGLSRSANTALVDSLWVPKQMVGENIAVFEAYGWQLKRELNRRESKKLRQLFSDQERTYSFKQCDPYVFNRSMVFVSKDSIIVGNIYMCPQGYSIEAFPSLRPGISQNFIWNEAGLEAVEEFLKKIER